MHFLATVQSTAVPSRGPSCCLLLQVSDKERQLELDSLFKDVASVLSEKCINPDNNKPYTISMLERALKDVHFSVDLHRNAKQQALEVSFSWLMHVADTLLVCLLVQLHCHLWHKVHMCPAVVFVVKSSLLQALPVLQAKFAIKRALMRLQIQVPKSCKAEAMDLLEKLQADVESRDFSSSQVGSQQTAICRHIAYSKDMWVLTWGIVWLHCQLEQLQFIVANAARLLGLQSFVVYTCWCHAQQLLAVVLHELLLCAAALQKWYVSGHKHKCYQFTVTSIAAARTNNSM